MEKNKYVFFLVMGLLGIFPTMVFGRSDDNVIINAIKQRSNLTQSDVDGWNFIWIRTFFSVEDPRINKIRQYVELCQKYAIAKQYTSQDSFVSALSQPNNALWKHGSAIAQNNGFENLLMQAQVADKIIEQVAESGNYKDLNELKGLRDNIAKIQENLKNNQKFIVGAVAEERLSRMGEQFVQGAKYVKGALFVGLGAWAASKQLKNVTGQWKLLKDIVNTGKGWYQEYAGAAN